MSEPGDALPELSAKELAVEHDESAATRAEAACMCPNASEGEHYNECRVIAPKREFGAVAGIIKTPGIDDALEAIESEEDVIASNRELLEGTQQSRAELERWRMLYQATLEQCNVRLLPRGICLGACAPNPNGLGAVFVGIDRDQRDYTVTLTLPARERVDFERASKEDFVRWAITVVCDEVVEQQTRYLKRMEMH